jgi:hypothetical protein
MGEATSMMSSIMASLLWARARAARRDPYNVRRDLQHREWPKRENAEPRAAPAAIPPAYAAAFCA